jgi:multidrug efflux pump subunit AcrA (membrane-fusion protein)
MADPTPTRTTPNARGVASAPIVIGIVVLALLAVGAILLRGGDEAAGFESAELFEVRRGDFDITIPASGELAALQQTEIASRLDGRAVILEVVEEGSLVEVGDMLIRFDREAIEQAIKDARDALNTAETAWLTAQSNLDIARRANQSAMAKANVEVRLAELDLKAWTEGDDVSRRQTLDLEVETKTKNYDRLVARFEASKGLLEKKFISPDEFLMDEIAMIEARSKLKEAKLNRQVYEEILAEKAEQKLVSDLQQAKDRRDELEGRHANEIARHEAEVASRKYHRDSRAQRLAEHEEQSELTTITAPQAGLVVYTSSLQSGRWGRNERTPPKPGAEVRRNDPIMLLPDTSRMVAEVKVNEALSGKIDKGNRAVVFSDAMPDTPLLGEVASVGVLAETGGWRDPNRRDYTIRIELDGGEDRDLKPAMRCRANIYVGRVSDALHVPIQAVFRRGPVAFAYVPDGNGFAEREVQVGRSSELYIEVANGLSEGEQVLLRAPSPERITSAIEVKAMDAGRPEGGGPPPGAGPRSASRGGEAKRPSTDQASPPSGQPGAQRTPAAAASSGGA